MSSLKRIVAISFSSILFAFSFSGVSYADKADPEYAARWCVKNNKPNEVCCKNVMDTRDKKEIAACVKLIALKREQGTDANAAAKKAKADAAKPEAQDK